MKNPGILWMLQVGAGLAMAGPMFIAGSLFLRSGDLLFAGLLFGTGLIALFAPNYFVRRIGGPRTWIRRRLGGRGGEDDKTTAVNTDDNSDGAVETDEGRKTGNGAVAFLERFRR